MSRITPQNPEGHLSQDYGKDGKLAEMSLGGTGCLTPYEDMGEWFDRVFPPQSAPNPLAAEQVWPNGSVSLASSVELPPGQDTSQPKLQHVSQSPATYRCFCGYEQQGPIQWQAVSFAQHQKTKHSIISKHAMATDTQSGREPQEEAEVVEEFIAMWNLSIF
jgi:hypothetical protein